MEWPEYPHVYDETGRWVCQFYTMKAALAWQKKDPSRAKLEITLRRPTPEQEGRRS